MSTFKKINLSPEEIEKTPVLNQPSTNKEPSTSKEPIYNPKYSENIKQKSVEKPDNAIAEKTDSQKVDKTDEPSTDAPKPEQKTEVPPGLPASAESDRLSDSPGSGSDGGSDSYDVTGIDFDEWYFPQGKPRWINY